MKWEGEAEYTAVMENTQEIQLMNLFGRNFWDQM